jgi:hypothetical protein
LLSEHQYMHNDMVGEELAKVEKVLPREIQAY